MPTRLRPHHILQASKAAPASPKADIAACLNQMVLLEKRIWADVGLLGGGTPTPTPTPTPPPSPGIRWPSYRGVATAVGASIDGLTNVFYDSSTGAQGLACAQQLVVAAQAINSGNAKLFGTPTGKVNVIVFALGGATDGTGGADHNGCDFSTGQNIEVCVDLTNPGFTQSLYEAELSECSMGGDLCGVSTGEALSRWAAMAIVPNPEFKQFATAPVWASDGFADWVDQTFTGTAQVPGDEDPNSTGCGMAFLSWLIAKHGVTLSQVAEEMVKLGNSGTLSQMCTALVPGISSVWSTFLADVKALPGGVTSDDPFGALAVATV